MCLYTNNDYQQENLRIFITQAVNLKKIVK